MGRIERRLHYNVACRSLQNIYERLEISMEFLDINWSKMFLETEGSHRIVELA